MTERLLRVNQVAERLGVNPYTVRKWIRAKRLAALNLAEPGSRKPNYRVAASSLAAFEAAASTEHD